jgi:hypothetical protein
VSRTLQECGFGVSRSSAFKLRTLGGCGLGDSNPEVRGNGGMLSHRGWALGCPEPEVVVG